MASASIGPLPIAGSGPSVDERVRELSIPHMLRAGFIMAALAAGVPLRDVQIAARTLTPELRRSATVGERTSTDTPHTSWSALSLAADEPA
jgi:hypothetical protein